MKTQVGVGVTLPQPRDTDDDWQPPEPRRGKKGFFLQGGGAGNGNVCNSANNEIELKTKGPDSSFPRAFRGSGALLTAWFLQTWPPELQGTVCAVSRLITQPQEAKTQGGGVWPHLRYPPLNACFPCMLMQIITPVLSPPCLLSPLTVSLAAKGTQTASATTACGRHKQLLTKCP